MQGARLRDDNEEALEPYLPGKKALQPIKRREEGLPDVGQSCWCNGCSKGGVCEG